MAPKPLHKEKLHSDYMDDAYADVNIFDAQVLCFMDWNPLQYFHNAKQF